MLTFFAEIDRTRKNYSRRERGSYVQEVGTCFLSSSPGTSSEEETSNLGIRVSVLNEEEDLIKASL